MRSVGFQKIMALIAFKCRSLRPQKSTNPIPQNPYLADTLIARHGGLRSSLNVVQRRSYSGPILLGSGVVTGAASVSESDPGIEPEPSDPDRYREQSVESFSSIVDAKSMR